MFKLFENLDTVLPAKTPNGEIDKRREMYGLGNFA